MADQLTVAGVPVYRDSAGVLREVPDARDEELRAQIAANERTFSEYGGGFIDYTDNGYTQGLTTSNTAALRYIVPPGHFVLLQQTISGTGTASIVAQTEEVLG